MTNYFNFAEVVDTVTKSLNIVFKSFVSTNFTTRALFTIDLSTFYLYQIIFNFFLINQGYLDWVKLTYRPVIGGLRTIKL